MSQAHGVPALPAAEVEHLCSWRQRKRRDAGLDFTLRALGGEDRIVELQVLLIEAGLPPVPLSPPCVTQIENPSRLKDGGVPWCHLGFRWLQAAERLRRGNGRTRGALGERAAARFYAILPGDLQRCLLRGAFIRWPPSSLSGWRGAYSSGSSHVDVASIVAQQPRNVKLHEEGYCIKAWVIWS